MSNITSLLENNTEHYDLFITAGKVAKEQNLSCYLVGGYVRDILLNRQSTDIDIMVEGDALSYAKILGKKIGVPKIVQFEEFGTARIPYDKFEIEVSSARSESYTKDSRNPKIEFSTFKDDMSRRDFTVNAIASSIHPDSFGELHDPFSGIKDLHKGLIITPLDPDTTFDDDPLRMLRAIRFSAQLGFDIAPNLLDSISRMKERMKIISWERITQELIKILSTKQPSIGFYALRDTGLLDIILPEFSIMQGVEIKNNMSHKDVFIHTLQVIDNAAELSDKMEIRFAALVHDIAKPQTKRFINGKGWTYHAHEVVGIHLMRKLSKRMKLSNELNDYLCKLIKLHLRPISLAMEGVTDSAIRRLIVEAGDDIDDLMVLCRADITTKNKHKIKKYLNNFTRVEELVKNVRLRDELRAFQSPVRGKEIMEKFNLKPGKDVGRIKKAIEDAILDGEIDNDYDQAWEFMM
ncbi:MAG: tRNA nucleotidyltransferase, partial [bacterium TMED161]